MFVEKQTAILINYDLISMDCHLREKNLRVFMFGDYAFLCAVYFISGANGETIILVFAKHTY